MISWSYSRLKDFETCPRKFYVKHVAKLVPFVPTPEMAAGTKFHESVESLIKSGKYTTPVTVVSDLDKVHNLIYDLHKAGFTIEAEKKMALNELLSEVTYFDKSTWVRGAADAVAVRNDECVILDWKTGRFNPDVDQLKIMSFMYLFINSSIKNITATLIYPRVMKSKSIRVKRTEASQIVTEFTDRVKLIEETERRQNWYPNPCWACPYCEVTKELCKYAGKKQEDSMIKLDGNN